MRCIFRRKNGFAFGEKSDSYNPMPKRRRIFFTYRGFPSCRFVCAIEVYFWGIIPTIVIMKNLTIKYILTNGTENAFNLDLNDLKQIPCENLIIILNEPVMQASTNPTESNNSFFKFCALERDMKMKRNKIRTAETYQSALNSFKQFRKDKDINISEITDSLIESYEFWLEQKGLKRNTIGFYMRVLRAIYNKAIKQGLTKPNNPFEKVYASVDKTAKRTIKEQDMEKIKNVKGLQKKEEFARDIFLLSFYLRGISFIDLSYLRKSNLKNGILTYRRRKTGQELKVGWEPCMQTIIDKWSDPNSPYLFPILSEPFKTNLREQYLRCLQETNTNLKKLGNLLNISVTLTTYTARHTWASIAKSKGIDINIISESMGHNNVNTTQIYLENIEQNVIDNANRKVISSIFHTNNQHLSKQESFISLKR